VPALGVLVQPAGQLQHVRHVVDLDARPPERPPLEAGAMDDLNGRFGPEQRLQGAQVRQRERVYQRHKFVPRELHQAEPVPHQGRLHVEPEHQLGLWLAHHLAQNLGEVRPAHSLAP